jgi:hypothetical protein
VPGCSAQSAPAIAICCGVLVAAKRGVTQYSWRPLPCQRRISAFDSS